MHLRLVPLHVYMHGSAQLLHHARIYLHVAASNLSISYESAAELACVAQNDIYKCTYIL